MRWFVRGDIDGFFGLALDNLVQLLLINALCRGVLGFPAELVTQYILPGAAVSVVAGNLFYSWQARRLALATGRADVCALPYGINTPSVFAHVFLVMLPAKLIAKGVGASEDEACRVAWQAGLMACLGSGVIEFLGAFVAGPLRRATPRAALLSTLAGIAVGFISGGFLLRTFAHPVVGLVTFGLILMVYFGRVRFVGGLPGGLVAVLVGVGLCWAGGLAPVKGIEPQAVAFHAPIWTLNELAESLRQGHLLLYLPVIIPMGVFNLLGSLQNIESADAAGDRFPAAPSLAVNGACSVAAGLFGSCFPTTIYIGHPGWKAMGARAGYSVLNAVFVLAVCLFGLLDAIAHVVPVDAGMAIVLWIGIVITAQAFQATPGAHAPAVVVGLLPGLVAWVVVMAKTALRVGGAEFDREKLFSGFQRDDVYLHGALALEQGFIFTSMILAAVTVSLIERRFVSAGCWALSAAALSAVGLMHSYQWTPADTTLRLNAELWQAANVAAGGDFAGAGNLLAQIDWYWALGYALMALCFFAARWVAVPQAGPDPHGEEPGH